MTYDFEPSSFAPEPSTVACQYIVSVDYDPGASETNQLNRIKLMVATAHKRHARMAQDAFVLDAQDAAGAPLSPVDVWETSNR